MARKKSEVISEAQAAADKMAAQVETAQEQVVRLMYTVSIMRQALRAVNQDEYGWDELSDETQEKVAHAMNMESGVTPPSRPTAQPENAGPIPKPERPKLG